MICRRASIDWVVFNSTASRSVDGSGTLGIPSGLPIRIGAAYTFRGVFFYSSRKVFLEPVLNSRALGALPVYF